VVKVVQKRKESDSVIPWSLILVFIGLALAALLSIIKETRARVEALKLTHLGDGAFKADGSEQIVFEYERAGPFRISGQMDLQEMEEGDVVLVRQYFKIRREEPYKLFLPWEYRGKQEYPVKRITPKEAMYGFRITLQQTAGLFKTFRWIFYAGLTS